MEAITAFINGLDLTKLVPNLESMLGKVHTLAVLAMLVGPVFMAILGAFYLFLPPKEANRKFGFRTYFGMGSVEAWRFTQKIAGLAYGGLGVLLTVIMGIICITMGGKSALQIVTTAFTCLVWELCLMLLAYLGVAGTVTFFFDKNGDRRQMKNQ